MPTRYSKVDGFKWGGRTIWRPQQGSCSISFRPQRVNICRSSTKSCNDIHVCVKAYAIPWPMVAMAAICELPAAMGMETDTIRLTALVVETSSLSAIMIHPSFGHDQGLWRVLPVAICPCSLQILATVVADANSYGYYCWLPLSTMVSWPLWITAVSTTCMTRHMWP